MKKALYFEKINNNNIRCLLCPHNCIIKLGETGFCNVRKNIDGTLYSTNYGKLSAINLDPIEKKPLHRYKSGSNVLSIGSYGCNFRCSFCQNYSISQIEPNTVDLNPQELANKAIELKEYNNIGVAYTYNEPTVYFEYMLETAKLIKKKGMKNILVSNGYINLEPLKELIEYIDAVNIDLKFYNNDSYKEYTKGELDPVRESIKYCHDKTHLEVTTLIIPNINDEIKEIEKISKFLSDISKDIVFHISRFYPAYKMKDRAPTSKEIMYKAKEKASEYLKYVYLGNI